MTRIECTATREGGKEGGEERKENKLNVSIKLDKLRESELAFDKQGINFRERREGEKDKERREKRKKKQGWHTVKTKRARERAAIIYIGLGFGVCLRHKWMMITVPCLSVSFSWYG